MRDKYGRRINYLRISVTDRCNLRCQYCMPPERVEYRPHEEILRYEEIVEIVKAGVELGIKKVRITGGEPLVRLGITDLVSQLAAIDDLQEISMTTNGTLLSKYAQDLKIAGLDRVNISLDTLQADKYREITRRDKFAEAQAGIRAALETGLDPVKINVVLMKGINDDEIFDFVELSRIKPLHVRFIEFMPLGELGQVQGERFQSLSEVKAAIMDKYSLEQAAVKSNGPAESFRIGSTPGSIGFISPLSHNFCSTCNRLRLTADGKLKPCLESELEVDLSRDNGQLGKRKDILAKFKEALVLKPDGHKFVQGKNNQSGRNMFQIGG